jgi:hypothetical protein
MPGCRIEVLETAAFNHSATSPAVARSPDEPRAAVTEYSEEREEGQ